VNDVTADVDLFSRGGRNLESRISVLGHGEARRTQELPGSGRRWKRFRCRKPEGLGWRSR
jgi:hypothetical protein